MDGKIHFLNTGASDCIIAESCGKIAMFDAGEDSDYPASKPYLNYRGYENEVVDYLLEHFRSQDGTVHIDFVLATHCHSDHIGGFDTVINHPDICVKTAYVKPYRENDVFIMERKRWDNTEVYNQMLEAVKANGVELVEDFDEKQIKLGDFDITFYNGRYKKRKIKFGENVNSTVALLKIGKFKALLAGDLNYKDNAERRIADKAGKVDLLKVGHHGYVFSTSFYWAKKLSPDYAVVCNSEKRIYPDVRYKLRHIAGAEILPTVDCNGIIADFSGSEIKIKTNIM